MEKAIEQVGFVGIGRMGAALAENILKAGFRVNVYNRTRDRLLPLVDKGAAEARSAKDAAIGADVVFTCLMDDTSMFEVMGGEAGLLAGLAPDAVHVATATISPGCSRTIAAMHHEHGSRYVSAPLIARPDAARAGQVLTFMSGNQDAIARCEPLFGAYSNRHVNLGPDAGLANSVKLAVNFMLMTQIEMMSEVFAFAERSGIDTDLVAELILTVQGHPAMKDYVRRIRARDFEPAAFDVRSGFKDLELVNQAGADVCVPMPFASALRQAFLVTMGHGLSHQDWTAISEAARIMAGLPANSPSEKGGSR